MLLRIDQTEVLRKEQSERMRILIVSDTHGKQTNLIAAIRAVKPDVMLHAGDVEGQENEIRTLAGCPVTMVRGNCDRGSELPKEAVVELEGYRFYIVHGHEQHVKFGLETLAARAKENGCGIAVYGHTHQPVVTTVDGVTVINPGSITFPRQDGRAPSYIVGSTDTAGRIAFKIMYL